jgi:hypothetical protein
MAAGTTLEEDRGNVLGEGHVFREVTRILCSRSAHGEHARKQQDHWNCKKKDASHDF